MDVHGTKLAGTLFTSATGGLQPNDYENQDQDDDFIKLAGKLIEASYVVFATPVYWYSMSGQMKVFFDRFTDLITIRKSFGRRLAGKQTFLVATGSDQNLPEGFEAPFRLTSDYLDMEFKASCYVQFQKDLTPADNFQDVIENFLLQFRTI